MEGQNEQIEEPQTDAKPAEEHRISEEKTVTEEHNKESPDSEVTTKDVQQGEVEPVCEKKEATEEPQEVVSSSSRDPPAATKPKRMIKSRSKSGRSYSFQNYGLAYLPYMSNFEPSEDARRRADEFLKALKL